MTTVTRLAWRHFDRDRVEQCILNAEAELRELDEKIAVAQAERERAIEEYRQQAARGDWAEYPRLLAIENQQDRVIAESFGQKNPLEMRLRNLISELEHLGKVEAFANR